MSCGAGDSIRWFDVLDQTAGFVNVFANMKKLRASDRTYYSVTFSGLASICICFIITLMLQS